MSTYQRIWQRDAERPLPSDPALQLHPDIPRKDLHAAPLAQLPDKDDLEASISNPRHNPGLKSFLAALKADPDKLASFTAGCKETDKNLAALAAPDTARKYRQVARRWVTICRSIHPEMTIEQCWHTDTIDEFCTIFFKCVLLTTRGSKNRAHVKFDTLELWMSNLHSCIIMYCHDDAGRKCGMKLLTDGGLSERNTLLIKSLGEEYNLDRYRDPQERFGLREVKLILETVIGEALGNGPRSIANVAQFATQLLSSLYLGLRGGSQGPSNAKYLKEGKFPKLKDVKVYSYGLLKFDVKVTYQHFKYHNGNKGHEFIATFRSVINWYNILHDISLWWVLHLFFRGALEGITKFDDLLYVKNAEIPIKENMKGLPIFLAGTSGGRGLVEGKPAMGDSISEHLHEACISAGLPPAGVRSLRKGTADFYNATMGKDFADNLFVHGQKGHMADYQDGAGVVNVDVVKYMLGEQEEEWSELVKDKLTINDMYGSAVTAVTYLANLHVVEQAPQRQRPTTAAHAPAAVILTPEDKAEIASSKELAPFLAAEASAWTALKKLRSTPTGKGAYTTANSLAAFLTVTERLEETTEDQDNEAIAAVKKTAAATSAEKRRLSKNKKNKKAAKRTPMLQNRGLGTVQQRQSALQSLNLPSELIVESVESGDRSKDHLFSEALAQEQVAAAGAASNRAQAMERMQKAIAQRPTISASSASASSTSASSASASSASRPPNSSASVVSSTSTLVEDAEPEISLETPEPELCELDTDDEEAPPEPGTLEHGAKKMLILVKKYDEKRRGPDDADSIELYGAAEAEEESGTPPSTAVNASLVRYLFAKHLLAIRAKAGDDLKETDGKWICGTCVSMVHSPKLQKEFSTRQTLNRHREGIHTDWFDLALSMYTTKPEVFQCPSATCPFEASTVDDVQFHCLSDQCCDSEKYKLMHEAHTVTKSTVRQNPVPADCLVPSPSAINYILAREGAMLRYLEAEPELSATFSEMFDFFREHRGPIKRRFLVPVE